MTGPIPTPVARYLAAEDDLDALTSAFLATVLAPVLIGAQAARS